MAETEDMEAKLYQDLVGLTVVCVLDYIYSLPLLQPDWLSMRINRPLPAHLLNGPSILWKLRRSNSGMFAVEMFC